MTLTHNRTRRYKKSFRPTEKLISTPGYFRNFISTFARHFLSANNERNPIFSNRLLFWHRSTATTSNIVLHIHTKCFLIHFCDILFHNFGTERKSVFMQSVNYRWDQFFATIWILMLECARGEKWEAEWRVIMDYSALLHWWYCRKMKIIKWNELRG